MRAGKKADRNEEWSSRRIGGWLVGRRADGGIGDLRVDVDVPELEKRRTWGGISHPAGCSVLDPSGALVEWNRSESGLKWERTPCGVSNGSNVDVVPTAKFLPIVVCRPSWEKLQAVSARRISDLGFSVGRGGVSNKMFNFVRIAFFHGLGPGCRRMIVRYCPAWRCERKMTNG